MHIAILEKEKGSSGLTFKKIDLHIHTPASGCFEDKTVTADQIVREAINKELSISPVKQVPL
jgi:hypothetical protein